MLVLPSDPSWCSQGTPQVTPSPAVTASQVTCPTTINHLLLMVCSPDDQPSDKLKISQDLVSVIAKTLRITLRGNKTQELKFWAAAIPGLKANGFAYLSLWEPRANNWTISSAPTQGRDPRQRRVALDWNRPVQPSFTSVGLEALLGLECVNQALCNPIYSYLFIALELREVMELFKKQEFSNARRANSSVHLAFLSGTYHTQRAGYCVVSFLKILKYT